MTFSPTALADHKCRNPVPTIAAERFERTIPLTDIFRARCEARALLYAAGELDLHEAVDELQGTALASGLVADIGQDGVQQIMSQAFELRDDLAP